MPGAADGGERAPLLSVRDLVVEFRTQHGTVRAVDGVSYDVYPGEVLGIVGESGSGKSVSTLAMLRLVPTPPGRVASGEALLNGRDLLGMSPRELRRVRGNDIAMIFQDPMTSLNPVLKIGEQLEEAIRTHHPRRRGRAVREQVQGLMRTVGIPSPERRVDQYPHEFSGGMRQRVMIAMAIANRPSLLIADEPTTALDVTIQAQILDVLREAQAETHAATIMITHDLGLIEELADRVLVMYAGRVVELADVETLFAAPRHPYTVGLMQSRARISEEQQELRPIPGQPPSLVARPSGCPFHPRCFLSQGRERCREETPPLEPVGDGGHVSACHFAGELRGAEPVEVAG
jgi:oligopeptide/dipeptide ABC transporter ATP-binding protein